MHINRLANAAEIKRAYRRLAVVFHPDKNQSPGSSSLFQEINEAHEVLSDPVKRALYDQLMTGAYAPVDVPPPQRHRDPAYRRKQSGYQPRPAQVSERLMMMVYLLRYLRLISWIGVGWVSILVIDYILPFRQNPEEVISESKAVDLRKTHHSAHVVFTKERHQFPVSSAGEPYFKPGTLANVVTSRMLNIIVRVESQNKEYTITSLGSVYQIFAFMPVILLIVSGAGLLLKNEIEFRFSLMIAICMFLLINLVFLSLSIL